MKGFHDVVRYGVRRQDMFVNVVKELRDVNSRLRTVLQSEMFDYEAFQLL